MTTRLLCLTSAAALLAGTATAGDYFTRIASFPVALNAPEGADPLAETAPEIVDATADGMTLVYTDSPAGVVGMVDIRDPAAPKPMGRVDVGGEPTSVAVIGGLAIVGVNTSESFTEPSGRIVALDIESGEEMASCDAGGQPDSVAKAPDGSFVAVAIENERDEDLNDGALPQMPAGHVLLIDVTDGALDCASLTTVTLAGLDGIEVAPEDPEPEYVSINADGEIVVTLQENNALVVLSRAGEVLSAFDAGEVTLERIDVEEEGALTFDATGTFKREPDAVAWIDADHFATANEGDYEGGSRGFTIFGQDGEVIWDSGTSFEHALVEIGHYPEGRSGNKGVEPESVTFAEYDGTPLLFVGSERGSVVGVYDVTDPAAPELVQLLPSGIGPEGYAAIPDRGLLVSANETDLRADGGPGAHVMIYQRGAEAPAYPQLTSKGTTLENGAPLGWGAISGMAADEDGTIWAVSDSAYAMQPTIFHIDVSETPARIVDVVRVTREGQPAQKLDLEGIVPDGEGGFWLASEGRSDRLVPHALFHVGADGAIQEEIGLPPELTAVEDRYGFEGIAMVDGRLWMAVQREWGDDPENMVKLVSYDPETEAWGAVRYEKAAADAGWVGLSEITAHGDHVYLVERDNQSGEAAATKLITRVPVADLQPAELGGDLPVVTREEVRDLLPDLTAAGGYVLDKVEGLAIMADGTAWVSTDNDGVDDHSGETMFFRIDGLD